MGSSGDQVYLDTPNVLIRWDGQGGYVLVQYRRWNDAKEVDGAIPSFLRAVREHHATRCLSDSRLRRVVQPAAQEAFVSRAIPPAAALGLKRLAIVLPQSVVAQTTVIPMVARYREHLTAEIFGTLEEAAAWLAVD